MNLNIIKFMCQLNLDFHCMAESEQCAPDVQSTCAI